MHKQNISNIYGDNSRSLPKKIIE